MERRPLNGLLSPNGMELTIECTQPPPVSVWELDESACDTQSEGWQSVLDGEDVYQRVASTQDDEGKSQKKKSEGRSESLVESEVLVKCAVLTLIDSDKSPAANTQKESDEEKPEIAVENAEEGNQTLELTENEAISAEGEAKEDSDEESVYLSVPSAWSSQSGQNPRSDIDGQEKQDWLEEDEVSQDADEADTTNFTLNYRHGLDSGDRTSLSLPLCNFENLCDKLYDENRSFQRYDPAYEGFTSFRSFKAPLLDKTFSDTKEKPDLSRRNSFRLNSSATNADLLNGSFRVVKKNGELNISKKQEDSFLPKSQTDGSQNKVLPLKKVPRKMPPSPKEKSPPRKTKRFNFSDNLFASIDPELTKLMSSGKGPRKAAVRRRKAKPSVPSYYRKSSIVVEEFDDCYSRD